jgi:hypothetical protein
MRLVTCISNIGCFAPMIERYWESQLSRWSWTSLRSAWSVVARTDMVYIHGRLQSEENKDHAGYCAVRTVQPIGLHAMRHDISISGMLSMSSNGVECRRALIEGPRPQPPAADRIVSTRWRILHEAWCSLASSHSRPNAHDIRYTRQKTNVVEVGAALQPDRTGRAHGCPQPD